MIPLAYVIRTNPQVPGTAPTLAPNQPHSTEHGSVEEELIARASHTHALFRDDNSVVYYHLEKATRGTSYAASIKPFTRAKDGRGAWKALTSQYAGKDKWEAEIKRQEQLLHTRIWKGQSNFSLENFISQHRNAYVSMQASAEHVQYQRPNEHSRVGFLLEAIHCSDAGLQAAMASIKTDNGPDGMRNNFEATATHLLPYDPVAMDKREELHKFHQSWILPLTPLRSQALEKLGFIFVTTRLVNTGTSQMSKRRNSRNGGLITQALSRQDPRKPRKKPPRNPNNP